MNVTTMDICHKYPRDQPTNRVKSVKYVLGSEGDFFGDLAVTFLENLDKEGCMEK